MATNVKHVSFNKTMSLQTRLLLAFMLTVLLPVLVIGLSSIILGFQDGQTQVTNRLVSVAVLKEAEIELWVSNLKNSLTLILTAEQVAFIQPHAELTAIKLRFDEVINKNPFFEALFLLDLSGQVIISTELNQVGKVYTTEPFFQQGLTKPTVSTPFYEATLDRWSVIVAYPLRDIQGEVVAVLAGRASIVPLVKIMERLVGTTETSETYLVAGSGIQLTPSRFLTGTVYVNTLGSERALNQHVNGVAVYNDYRNQPVIGAYRWLPELQVALLAEQDQAEALIPTYQNLLNNLIIGLIATVFTVIASLFITRNITNPLVNLAETASRITAGDLSQVAQIERQDEIGHLAEAFNAMTSQLSSVIGSLEGKIVERTRQLEIVATVSEQLTAILNLNQLLEELVQQIKAHFHYHQVQVYLLDEFRQLLVMQVGLRDESEAMQPGGQTIALDLPTSLVAQAAQTAEIKLNVGGVEMAEMAVPIILEQRVVGVLHVQQSPPASLDESDIALLRSLANQVAVAIRNARLFAQVEAALVETQAVQRQYLEVGWNRDLLLAQMRYLYSQNQANPLPEAIIVQAKAATLASERLTRISLEAAGLSWEAVTLPVTFRNIEIGTVQLHAHRGKVWQDEDLMTIEAVVDQLGQIAERLRLFENTRRQATNEQIIREITDKLRSAPNFSRLMQIATEELGKRLSATHANIEIRLEDKL